MQISFQDFRSFHDTNYIDLKRVNLLVGENSSGKTSFLAGIRFLYSLFSESVPASLNQYPYYLGSYEDIAHFRGGRFGRATQFKFSVRGYLRKSEIDSSVRYYESSNNFKMKVSDQDRTYTLDISFSNFRSQPRVKSIEFKSGRYRLIVDLEAKEPVLRAKIPIVSEEIVRSAGRFFAQDPHYFNVNIVRYLLSELVYAPPEKDGVGARPEGYRQEMIFLSGLYLAAQSQIGGDVYATAPVRTEPRRIYNPADIAPTSEGENAPILLAQMSAFDSEKWERLKQGLDKFGKASGLFSSINVKHLSRSKNGPFQITISIGKVKSSIVDVGYGVSQALPIIYELLVREKSSIFLFQQPEVHLHPKAQAELASFIIQTASDRRHQVFIETHSDYLVDRIRMDIRDGKVVEGFDCGIIYFRKNDLDTDIIPININRDGSIDGAPNGYREFFLREKARSIGITKS